jgi:hypothetical protein
MLKYKPLDDLKNKPINYYKLNNQKIDEIIWSINVNMNQNYFFPNTILNYVQINIDFVIDRPLIDFLKSLILLITKYNVHT